MDSLYTINPAAAARLDEADTTPVLLYAFEGFVDSGLAAGLAIGDLVNREDTERLVTFNADELLDYRSRRPPMTFAEGGWTDYHQPSLAIDLAHDAAGSPFLLMYGPEPDMRWEAFADAVVEVAETFDIRLAIAMHGIPSAAPHTREWKVTGPDQSGDLVNQVAGSRTAKIQLPGSAMALTELKLREIGREAQTFTVHVPHYLSQLPSPIGTARLMRAIGSATGLDFDLGQIEEAAEVQTRQLEKQVSEQPELAAAIAKMEERHDSEQSHAPAGELLAEAIPTGDEIAAEFERFLASQPGDDEGSPFTE
ncbi:MAG: PAC2 family protein [Bifidobacteriaceae bacterium]|jgi:hypothetical protein|nr:PAC2 family protein [Bifidobacteriaceae bacterium]